MRCYVTLLLLFSFVLVPSIAAQDTTPTSIASWTFDRHCIDEFAQRPEGWTFSGTILMTGYAGIHGVNDNWETPRVVVPLHFDQTNTDIVGGALSPDGRWYASPFGDRILTQSNNVLTTVREIDVYSTSGEGQEYKVILVPAIESIPQGYYTQIYWQDNQWVLYTDGEGDKLINPFTQVTQRLDGYHFNDVFDRFGGNPHPHLAPDFTLAVSKKFPPFSDPQWGLYTVPADDLFSAEPLIQLGLAETSVITSGASHKENSAMLTMSSSASG